MSDEAREAIKVFPRFVEVEVKLRFYIDPDNMNEAYAAAKEGATGKGALVYSSYASSNGKLVPQSTVSRSMPDPAERSWDRNFHVCFKCGCDAARMPDGTVPRAWTCEACEYQLCEDCLKEHGHTPGDCAEHLGFTDDDEYPRHAPPVLLREEADRIQRTHHKLCSCQVCTGKEIEAKKERESRGPCG